MRVILFGATGMVGQGVLRECLLDRDVEIVLAVGRSALPPESMWRGLGAPAQGKLRHLVLKDLTDCSGAQQELSGFDACLFCLGVSSVGMTEADYRSVTYGIALAAAETLARLNPAMTFEYVSGAGTDGTGRSRTMWARVKGETENALLRLPFKGAYMFRPGFIQPLDGIRSRTRMYSLILGLTRPVFPLLRRLFPRSVTTSEQLGRAMLRVAKEGYPKPVLEVGDITGF